MELWIFALGVEFYEILFIIVKIMNCPFCQTKARIIWMALPKKCFGLKFGGYTIGNVTKQKSATLLRPDDLGQNKIKSLPNLFKTPLLTVVHHALISSVAI